MIRPFTLVGDVRGSPYLAILFEWEFRRVDWELTLGLVGGKEFENCIF